MSKQDEMDEDSLEHEDEEYAESRAARFLPAAVLTIAVLGFGGLAWHAYRSGTTPLRDDEVLLVEAEKAPLKEKPADPGGMQFPHQDKTVFDTVASGAPKPAPVERVMPGAEEPVNMAAANNAQPAENSASPAAELANKSPSAGGEVPAEEAPKPAEEAAKPAEEKPVEIKEVPVATPPQPKPAEKKVEKVAEKPASGSQSLQLGAYRSEAEAKSEWAKLIKKFPTQLAGKSPSYTKVEVQGKGSFTRLRVSGFKDAKSVCTVLSAKGQPCMMVK